MYSSLLISSMPQKHWLVNVHSYTWLILTISSNDHTRWANQLETIDAVRPNSAPGNGLSTPPCAAGDMMLHNLDTIGSNHPCQANRHPAIRRVHAASLTFLIRRVSCHSNETGAPTANPPNSAQLGSTLYHYPRLHPGPWSSVRMWWGTDRQTYRRPWPQYISIGYA